MRRYKIVARILLILSVFSFVLAVPIAVRGVREAYTDAVDEGGDVIIGLGKRGGGDDKKPLLAQENGLSSSSGWLAPSQHQESSLASTYASGADPNPSVSSGKSKPPPLSVSGGTELSWNSVDKGKWRDDEKPLLAQENGLSSSSGWLAPSQHQESSSAPTYLSGADPNPSVSPGKSKPPPLSV
jgi:hypothetical protein